jgi:hypothetical protein
MVKDYSKDVIRFTGQITSTLMTKGITKAEFIDDIDSIKSKEMNQSAFKRKYDLLFNGTYANFKNVSNFLGSYRRNINPNYFTQIKQKDIHTFNQELRFYTTEYKRIDRKVKSNFPNPFASRNVKSTKDNFHENIGYKGFAKSNVIGLKNAWNLNKVRNNKLFPIQCVQFRLNYDLKDLKGNDVYTNQWITVSSKYSTKQTLENLYDFAMKQMLLYIAKLEQSNLFIKMRKACTYVIRDGQ